MAEEMVEYAEENMPNFNNEQELVFFWWSKMRLLMQPEKKGYAIMHENVDLVCDFRKTELNYQLPSRISFCRSTKM